MKKWKHNKKSVDVPLKMIHPNFKNPRKGTYDKEKLEILKESLMSIGQLTPIKIDENGTILSGHRRFEAARQLEWSSLRCDVFVGLDDFSKSAILIGDNATQEKFDAWGNRKAISDIYWNEFCEVYEFKGKNDKGYSTFAKKLGISLPQARRCVESMARENITTARKLESAGCGTDVFDEVLDTPKKYREQMINKALSLASKKGKKLGKKVDKKPQLRHKLRMFRKTLVAKDAIENLNPSFFKVIHSKLDSIGMVLTKEVFQKATEEQKREMKENIKRNIIPFWNMLIK